MIPFIRDSGKQVLFSANSRASQELNRGMVLREIYLRLQGQLTLAAASNTVANTGIGDEWAIIKDLVLRLDGKDIIKRVDGKSLRWLDYFLYGNFPKKSLNTIADGATLNPSFDSTLILPLWMPRSVRAMDFALDTRLLSRLDLEILWGTLTDINNAATAFVTNPTLSIYTNEVTNVQGNFARWNLFPLTTTFAGAANQQQFKLPTGFMYRSFLINTSVSGLISVMRFKAGALSWAELPYQVVDTVLGNTRRGNDVDTGIVANTNWRAGVTGDALPYWMYLDMVQDGFNSEAIDTFGMTDAWFEADITGAGTVTIYPSQLVVPRTSVGRR